MKSKYWIIFLSALLLDMFCSLEAQELTISVKADTVLISGGTCKLDIHINGGEGPYTYMLYDGEPWEGGKLLEKSQPINEYIYSFSITAAGKYFIAVRDNTLLTKTLIIEVKPGTTSSLFINHFKNITDA